MLRMAYPPEPKVLIHAVRDGSETGPTVTASYNLHTRHK